MWLLVSLSGIACLSFYLCVAVCLLILEIRERAVACLLLPPVPGIGVLANALRDLLCRDSRAL